MALSVAVQVTDVGSSAAVAAAVPLTAAAALVGWDYSCGTSGVLFFAPFFEDTWMESRQS